VHSERQRRVVLGFDARRVVAAVSFDDKVLSEFFDDVGGFKIMRKLASIATVSV
jgi:hypothetical protein